MPHFRNFHGPAFSKSAIGDLGIDQETITADKGVDEIYYADALTILAEEGHDKLVLKSDIDSDTINADQGGDDLFDPRDFGETPPLDLAYGLVDLDDMGETPPDELSYVLDIS